YRNRKFLDGFDARPLRILAEYMEPQARFEDAELSDTIVFMGSARLLPLDKAERRVAKAERSGKGLKTARMRLAMAHYYEDARELARRLTEWSKTLEGNRRRFVVCTGGGPGAMEAANRGASEARGLNVGLGISLPKEAHGNPYITHNLSFDFHYFFMRKFWFIYLAKAIVFFPGGFGTLDEFFETLTLVQTGKLEKKLPLVLYGTDYWDRVLNLDALVENGMIDDQDPDRIFRANSVDEAFRYITAELLEYALADPGGRM
ncbi:MAG: LOG family protein, partial [Rhodospirillales bacterium]|nr:LOG family protein [Rhodospirillales bacterium]